MPAPYEWPVKLSPKPSVWQSARISLPIWLAEKLEARGAESYTTPSWDMMPIRTSVAWRSVAGAGNIQSRTGLLAPVAVVSISIAAPSAPDIPSFQLVRTRPDMLPSPHSSPFLYIVLLSSHSFCLLEGTDRPGVNWRQTTIRQRLLIWPAPPPPNTPDDWQWAYVPADGVWFSLSHSRFSLALFSMDNLERQGDSAGLGPGV